MRIDDSDYDWELAYKYKGNSGDMHYVYYLWYVPAGRSDSCNQYGYYNPVERLLRVNLTPRDDPIKTFRWTDKDTGMNYEISYGYMDSYTFTWKVCASIGISKVYINESMEPNTTGYVTVDLKNTGGDGVCDVVLLDGDIELGRDAPVNVSAGGFERCTFTYTMLPQDMTLMIRVIDRGTGDVTAEETRTIQLPNPCDGVICPNQCVGVDLYEYGCVDGVCQRGDIILRNSTACGYIEHIPEPAPEPIITPVQEPAQNLDVPDNDGVDTMVFAAIGLAIPTLIHLYMRR